MHVTVRLLSSALRSNNNIIVITLFKLLKMYQFVKNKLVLIHEQINIIFLKLHKNDNKG